MSQRRDGTGICEQISAWELSGLGRLRDGRQSGTGTRHPTAGRWSSGTGTNDGTGREVAVGIEISRNSPLPYCLDPPRRLPRVPLLIFFYELKDKHEVYILIVSKI